VELKLCLVAQHWSGLLFVWASLLPASQPSVADGAMVDIFYGASLLHLALKILAKLRVGVPGSRFRLDASIKDGAICYLFE
jgi:hypothetical protein